MQFNIRKYKGGTRKALISGLSISDRWSAIDIPEFSMSYNDAKDFKDFIRKIGLTAVVRESRVDMQTLAYFAPKLGNARLSWIYRRQESKEL